MYKEFDELLENAQKGDIYSKEEIINRLKPLIISSINNYYLNSNDFEDLIQEGNLIILECINNYDSSRGTYFLGYVKTMLKFNYLNKHRNKIHISLNNLMGDDSEEELIDFLESEEENPLEHLISLENKYVMRNALSKLTNRQREIVVLFYVERLSIGEIAKKLSITYRTVVNTKTVALEKMRKELEIEKI